MTKLQRSLEQQKRQTKQETFPIAGLLGIPLNGQRRVEVPSRNSFVYVRLRSNQSEVIQVYNNKVSPAYNLPVLVERQGNKYVILGVDSQKYENNWRSQSAFLPRHGNTHSFDQETGGGGDIVWVYPRQITPVLVMPSGSTGTDGVIVNPYTIRNDDGTWRYVGNTGTASLAPYRPTSPTGAIMALVYLDANTGNPSLLINSGSVFSNSLTGTSQIIPYIPAITNPNIQIPLAAIRLITGTSRISWDNIYDVRQFIHSMSTGSSGGLSSIYIQDEGIPRGSVDTLNFVGNNIQSTVSGSVARISVTDPGSAFLVHEIYTTVSGTSHYDTLYTMHTGTLSIFYNGLRQKPGTHFNEDADGGGYTLLFSPIDGENLLADYMTSTTGTSAPSGGVTVINNGTTGSARRYYFPLGVYGAPPFAAQQIAFVGTVDQNFSIIRWSQTFSVGSPNNSSNCWRIMIQDVDAVGTASPLVAFDTGGFTHTIHNRNQAIITGSVSITTALKAIRILVSPTGSPGNLTMYEPALLVEEL